MTGIRIRRGTSADLEQVMAIAAQSETAAHWRPTDYQQIFSSSRLLLVAGAPENKLIGFLIAHNIAGEWELENVAVHAEFRRQQVAKRLVSALANEAQKSSAKFIFLEVRESNVAAKLLYERCGFQQHGRRKSYYSNPSEDALLYRFLCSPATLENC